MDNRRKLLDVILMLSEHGLRCAYFPSASQPGRRPMAIFAAVIAIVNSKACPKSCGGFVQAQSQSAYTFHAKPVSWENQSLQESGNVKPM